MKICVYKDTPSLIIQSFRNNIAFQKAAKLLSYMLLINKIKIQIHVHGHETKPNMKNNIKTMKYRAINIGITMIELLLKYFRK